MKIKIMAFAVGVCCLIGMFAGCSGTPQGDKIPQEYGEMTIENVSVSIDQNKNSTFAVIDPVFSIEEKAEPLRYVYDTSYLNISENGVVTACKRENKTVNVRAECLHDEQHFRTVFSVEIKYIPYDGAGANPLYELKKASGEALPVELRTEHCKAVRTTTTLLIGDSFMDTDFIGEYMSTWAEGKDVLNAGMSSSSSYHWERTYSQIIGGTAPKNIAVHIGTNNFYDFRDTLQGTEESLVRLFSMMHVSYPSANLYFFTITQRVDTKYETQVREVNAFMKEWCRKYDWVTCVDTSALITTDMLRDGVHPKTEHYAVFTEALAKAGCEIAEK